MKFKTHLSCLLKVSFVMGLAGGSPSSWAEPDEALLGKQAGYPIGPRWSAMENRVGAWSALDKVPGVLGQFVQRGDTVSPLPKAVNPPAIQYRYRNLA